MIVASLEFILYAPWVHSLKEKRMVTKSILQKTQHQFHVSAAETAFQDVQQTIGIAFAVIASTMGQIDSMLDHIITYVESHAEAEVIQINRTVY